MTDQRLVTCLRCEATVRVPGRATRDEWHCPQCGEPFRSDTKAESPAKLDEGDEQATYRIAPQPEPKRRKRKSPAQYAWTADEGPKTTRPAPPVPAEPVEPLPTRELSNPDAPKHRERLRVELDPPPARPFLSNVFGFPWQSSVLGVWLLLGGALTGVIFLCLLMYSLYLGAVGMVSAVAAFIALPTFWIGAWTFSYASAASLVVIEEAAAGNNQIREWMEPNWRDWMGQLFCILYVGCLPLAFAWPVVALTGRTYSESLVPLLAVEFFLFPILLLAALERDSVWSPFSGPVFSSLLRSCFAWLTFFAFTAVVVAAVAGAAYFSVGSAGLIAAFWLGPLTSAAILIYSRLLGRLGWVIIDRAPERDDRPSDRRGELPVPSE